MGSILQWYRVKRERARVLAYIILILYTTCMRVAPQRHSKALKVGEGIARSSSKDSYDGVLEDG